ncbi:MAG TPA: LLM class flavin-dependent oxidoreductase [Acidimicrobiales bacterium]|nr:LLM class flavin-dependent oxidoreductase [Acidimicrobiales bacterium]
MKIRVGVGTHGSSSSGQVLHSLASRLEDLGFDSIWLPDVLAAPVDDPLTALAFVAASVRRLKLGVTLVLPGRNPVRLARQLATVDRLSGGRLLVTTVVGLRRRRELAAMGVEAGEREQQMDELLPRLRQIWRHDEVTPLQDPFDLWVGGTSAGALRRAGLLSDGWLPSMCTPDEAADGRRHIEEHAEAAGRRIDPEHFGVSIGYLRNSERPDLLGRLAARRPGVDMAEVVPVGLDALRALMERYVDGGLSKFVVRPIEPPASWDDELEELAQAVLPLQG